MQRNVVQEIVSEVFRLPSEDAGELWRWTLDCERRRRPFREVLLIAVDNNKTPTTTPRSIATSRQLITFELIKRGSSIVWSGSCLHCPAIPLYTQCWILTTEMELPSFLHERKTPSKTVELSETLRNKAETLEPGLDCGRPPRVHCSCQHSAMDVRMRQAGQRTSELFPLTMHDQYKVIYGTAV